MSLTWILVTALGSWFAASVIAGCVLGRVFAGPSARRTAPAQPAQPAPVSLAVRREAVEVAYGRPLRSVA